MKRIRLFGLVLAMLLATTALATTYQYDDLGRLVGEAYDSGVEITYSYDAVGNRTSRTVTTPEPTTPLFADGFESGTTGAWSVTAQ